MPKQASGGSRLKASGRKPVLLGLTPSEHSKVRRAAKIERRPMTQFLLRYGLAAAEKILSKNA